MLINLESLEKRREFAMVSLINDIISQRVDSPELLEKLYFYAPSRPLRTRNVFLPKTFKTDYAKNGPLNRMMEAYNKHSEIIDLTMSKPVLKKQFFSIRR